MVPREVVKQSWKQAVAAACRVAPVAAIVDADWKNSEEEKRAGRHLCTVPRSGVCINGKIELKSNVTREST